MQKNKVEINMIDISGDITTLINVALDAKKNKATNYECYSGKVIFFHEESNEEYLLRLQEVYTEQLKKIKQQIKLNKACVVKK